MLLLVFLSSSHAFLCYCLNVTIFAASWVIMIRVGSCVIMYALPYLPDCLCEQSTLRIAFCMCLLLSHPVCDISLVEPWGILSRVRLVE